MAKIRPLKGIIYNKEKIKDLIQVVSPPYDVISPLRQEYYHALSPYNIIHMLLGKDMPDEDKYQRAANFFNDWLKNKILIEEETPAVYFYSQQYNIKGEKKVRLGFIARLCLDEKKCSVFGHEHTHLEPKEDRLKLIKKVKANLSPIFVIFEDKKRIIQSVQRRIQGKTPFIDITDDEKVIHKVWRIDSPDILENMQKSMSGENIFIADGHHRYEVACAFKDEMKKKLKDITGEEPFNYILSYFTNTDPRGLTILPVHRLIKLGPLEDIKKILSSISDYFYIEEVKDKARFFFLMEKGGRTEHVLGMYCEGKYRLLRLKNIKILDKVIDDKPPEFKSLDVAILNYAIIKNTGDIQFGHNAEELIAKVDNDPSYIAFFLNPVKIQQIISVALSGNKMPPKSTYFYPKVLSGLVINKLK